MTVISAETADKMAKTRPDSLGAIAWAFLKLGWTMESWLVLGDDKNILRDLESWLIAVAACLTLG